MDGHHATARLRARSQEPVEDILLQVKVAREFIAAVQAYLTNVFALTQQPDKQRHLAVPLMNKLGGEVQGLS